MFDDGISIESSLTPVDVLQRWPVDRRVAWLHSARPDPRWARWSVLGEPDDQPLTVEAGDVNRNVFAELDACLSDEQAFYIGWVSYDLGRFVEQIAVHGTDDTHWPIVHFERCTGFATYDNVHKQWQLFGTWQHDPPAVFSQTSHAQTQASQPFTFQMTDTNLNAAAYRERVERVRQYIAAGDVFQVNLARRQSFRYRGNPRQLSLELARSSPAWYAGYIEATSPQAGSRYVMCAASPELFLDVDADRQVTTRPMKGTRPATTPAADLRDSQKDQAELNMIVDLMRNDLGRVCEVGSIAVAEPRTIESHPTVHQAVATVRGRLHPKHSLGDLLRATMPGGSITGAPKVRAMEIIEELEPTWRGAYCGAYGWMRGQRMSLAMTIRTALLEHDTNSQHGVGHFHVGAGIVADSKPEAEYEETCDKAAAMISALNQLQKHERLES